MRDISEAAFQGQVFDVAGRYRWRALHFPDSRRATMPGWTDLVLIKGPRVVFAELKTRTGRVSPDQRVVLTALAASGAEVALWRPADMPDIVAVLGRAARRAELPPGFIPQEDPDVR